MSDRVNLSRRVALGCGGTGGHLFPGLAIAQELFQRGCSVTLLISPKEVDQEALRNVSGFDVVTLPAVGLTRGRTVEFLRGFRDSYRRARAEFQTNPPQAALAMGGFTSAPPVLAAKRFGALTFLHESNTIPGRANRWLSWVVDEAFVGFSSTAGRLHTRRVAVTGTPVRRQIMGQDAGSCRSALGLDPARPVVLVTGGSQGASAINDLVCRTLDLAARSASHWQWLHLTGAADFQKVRSAYARAGVQGVVQKFCSRMDLALGAATAAVSRAGASSLAELAELQIPAILLPYPAATDNHQFCNARAFSEVGAAVLLPQAVATPENLNEALRRLVDDEAYRGRMRESLGALRKPRAAQEIAEAVIAALDTKQREISGKLSSRAGESGRAEASEDKPFQSRGSTNMARPAGAS